MLGRRRYANEPLDISSRRSIEIRSLPHANDDRIIVDYFYHLGEFWTAIIPLDSVRHIFGQAFNFSKPKMRNGSNGPEIDVDQNGLPKRTIRSLNHVQCRFVMHDHASVQLFPLNEELDGEPSHELRDFVYSFEAVGPIGVKFNFRDAMTGNLISAHRILSTEEMVFERIVVEGQYVTESPELPLKENEKKAALCECLKRSDRAGMSEVYYLFHLWKTNNCTSSSFQILDNVVNYSWKQRIGSLLYRFPLNPRFYLRIRGMDSEPSVKKLVRHEFDEFVGHPETQKRKRVYVRSKIKALREAKKTREQDS